MILEDKKILITGAGGGIGSVLSKLLDGNKSQLILIDNDKKKLLELEKGLKSKGHKYHLCDLTNTRELLNVVNKVKTNNSSLDILINLAGIGIYKYLEDLTLEDWDKSFLVNVRAPFILIKELIPVLKKSGNPLIINVGSGMGKIPTPKRAAYCSSKFALRGLSLTLSKEFRESNIRVLHIALGSTMTSFGPLTIDQKKMIQKEGKEYFTPDWVVRKLINIITSDNIEDEVTLYPPHYPSKISGQ